MKVVVIGAGGHGMVVADILFCMRDAGMPIEPIAFVDDCPPAAGRSLSLRVLPGGVSALASLQYDAVIVAIGDNATRRRISEELRRAGVPLATARHPSSVVASEAQVEPGSMICAGVFIGPLTHVGTGTILNTYSSVDHHNIIGDYVHVGPGARLGGGVSVGHETLIGIGATVIPQRSIGRRVVVGAGAVVTRNLPDGVLAVGVPARARVRRVAHSNGIDTGLATSTSPLAIAPANGTAPTPRLGLEFNSQPSQDTL